MHLHAMSRRQRRAANFADNGVADFAAAQCATQVSRVRASRERSFNRYFDRVCFLCEAKSVTEQHRSREHGAYGIGQVPPRDVRC